MRILTASGTFVNTDVKDVEEIAVLQTRCALIQILFFNAAFSGRCFSIYYARRPYKYVERCAECGAATSSVANTFIETVSEARRLRDALDRAIARAEAGS